MVKDYHEKILQKKIRKGRLILAGKEKGRPAQGGYCDVALDWISSKPKRRENGLRHLNRNSSLTPRRTLRERRGRKETPFFHEPGSE